MPVLVNNKFTITLVSGQLQPPSVSVTLDHLCLLVGFDIQPWVGVVLTIKPAQRNQVKFKHHSEQYIMEQLGYIDCNY